MRNNGDAQCEGDVRDQRSGQCSAQSPTAIRARNRASPERRRASRHHRNVPRGDLDVRDGCVAGAAKMNPFSRLLGSPFSLRGSGPHDRLDRPPRRKRTSVFIAANPSRQPIFLPAARDRGANVTGRSTMRWPARSSGAVISGSMSKRFAVRLEAARDVAAHDLVAGLHVGQRRSVQHVRERRQHAIRDAASGTARRGRRRETATRTRRRRRRRRIGSTSIGQLRRIELEVRILNRDDRAARARDPSRTACPLPRFSSAWTMRQRRARRGQRVERRRACHRSIRR